MQAQTSEFSDAFEELITLCQQENTGDEVVAAARAQKVQQLLDGGVDVNTKNYMGGRSPLAYATEQGHIDICNLLIQGGAAVNARDNSYYSPLIYAALRRQEAICRLLIDNGADVNASDSRGYTALHAAIFKSAPYLCKMLIAGGANPNTVYNDGSTALHDAVNDQNIYIVHTLLLAGGDPDIKDQYGNTPRDKRWFNNAIDQIAEDVRGIFHAGEEHYIPARKDCLGEDGQPTRAVLDACITDQFHQLIALPLINARDRTSLDLCQKIFEALPNHMKAKNNQTAALLTKREGLGNDILRMGSETGPHAMQEESRREASVRPGQGLGA